MVKFSGIAALLVSTTPMLASAAPSLEGVNDVVDNVLGVTEQKVGGAVQGSIEKVSGLVAHLEVEKRPLLDHLLEEKEAAASDMIENFLQDADELIEDLDAIATEIKDTEILVEAMAGVNLVKKTTTTPEPSAESSETEETTPEPEVETPAPEEEAPAAEEPVAVARRLLPDLFGDAVESTLAGLNIEDAVVAISELTSIAAETEKKVKDAALLGKTLALKNANQAVAGGLKRTVERTGGLAHTVTSDLGQLVQSSTQSATDTVVEGADQVVKTSTDVGTVVSDTASDLGESAAEVVSNLGEAREGAQQAINDAVTDAVLETLPTDEEIAEVFDVLENVQSMKKAIKLGALDSIVGAVQGTTSQILEKVPIPVVTVEGRRLHATAESHAHESSAGEVSSEVSEDVSQDADLSEEGAVSDETAARRLSLFKKNDHKKLDLFNKSGGKKRDGVIHQKLNKKSHPSPIEFVHQLGNSSPHHGKVKKALRKEDGHFSGNHGGLNFYQH